jgi:hypothetical protein
MRALRRMMSRRWMLMALLAALPVGFVAVRLVQYLTDPYGALLRADVPEVQPMVVDASRMSQQSYDDHLRMYNRIGRRTSWSADDQKWLLTVLRTIPDTVLRGERMDEQFMRFSDGMVIIAGRLGHGVPTPEAVTKAFREAMLIMLVHPIDHFRLIGLSSAMHSGLLYDPEIRPHVDRIRQEDPSELVRGAADRFVRFTQGLFVDDPGCPTCPSGDG